MAKDSSNKKGNSKDNVKKGPQKKGPSFQRGKVLFTVFSIIGGIASYLVYRELFTPPPLPDLDLQEWWGTYPINPNPDKSIRPFKIEFPAVIINDLRERLLHRRPFQPPLEGAGFTYGFNSAFLTRVLDYWQHSYKFQEREQFLNKYPHYKTNVQGLDIHYIHVKPQVEEDVEVVPILLLHGWPGSVREFYELIPLLTTPRSEAGFVFEIIAPSLPGFGFSQATTRPGLSSTQMAVIMRNLMHRVGLPRYYVQGGDWGAIIGGVMATVFPNEVMGLHTNMPFAVHPVAFIYTFLGSLWPSAVSSHPEEETRMYPLSERIAFIFEESGYSHLHATKPDTVGIALTDSPAGLAAYILEKFSTWTDPKYRLASDGNLLGKYALTNLLDNIMIYWSTNSITTSVRLYAEAFGAKNLALKMDQIPTDVPTWGLKMRHELITQPDCAIRVKYRNYLHTTLVGQGGHFAAFELPEVVGDDIYKAVQMFRSFHGQNSKKMEKSAPDANNPTQGTTMNSPSEAEPTTTPPKDPTTIYDFVVKDIKGKEVKLEKYRGHVTLIVNVASECGFTDNHYKQLNELHDKYAASKGLRILAFPCNQFGGQEPGSLKDILAFTKAKRVKFDLFAKVEVNGENAHPLWKFLKEKQRGTLIDSIKWNFTKFIVDKNGVPVERLAPTTEPLSLEPILAKYW